MSSRKKIFLDNINDMDNAILLAREAILLGVERAPRLVGPRKIRRTSSAEDGWARHASEDTRLKQANGAAGSIRSILKVRVIGSIVRRLHGPALRCAVVAETT